MAQTSQTQTDVGTAAKQVLQNAWSTNIDAQTSQQLTGLTQIRQARANQLQREAASLSKEFGPTDAGVIEVQASLTTEQTFASRLGVVRDVASTNASAAPDRGWVLQGRVRNPDLTPVEHLTVFLVDEGKTRLETYGYSFTDQTGYFVLSYTPDASAQRAAAAPLSAYLEVTNPSSQPVFLDSAPMSLAASAAVYRDIVLSGEGALGSPPAGSGTQSPTPPARKKK